MNPSIARRLQALAERHDEVQALLAEPNVIGNHERFRKLSQEYAELNGVVAVFRDYQRLSDEREAAHALLDDPDEALRAMATEEVARADARLEQLEQELKTRMLPKDPDDRRNVFLEIRAGTGGTRRSWRI